VVATVTVVGFAPRADAHICTNPVQVNVGEDVTINIGVAAEEKPVTAVDIAIPPGFELKDQIGYLGWVGTRVGDSTHFEGAEIKPYSCAYFTFKGVAPQKGKYLASITVHAADGSTTKYIDANPYSLFPALGIYAGVPIPSQGVSPGGGSGDGFPWMWLAIAVVAGGVAVAFAVVWNRRRDATADQSA